MQFFCRHCGELIRLVEGKVGCPNGCLDPIPQYQEAEEWTSEIFSRDQMQCKCGCAECDLDHRLVPALEKLSARARAEIEIVEAYRCAKFRDNGRGVSKLAHLDGRAADIRIRGMNLQQMYDLAEEIEEFREGGIGVYDDGTLHVDVRVLPARWARLNGLYLGIEGSKLLSRRVG